MEQTLPAPYSHDVIDAGIDWITATALPGVEGECFRAVGESLLQEQISAGRNVRPALLRDYTGWRGEHCFVGMREADSIIVASQDMAARHWRTVSLAARNVSRVDLQASVWTHGEQPQLARWSHAKLKRSPAKRGRPRSFTLIQTHPYGETLNVGKRQSDTCGRLYDWSAAHKQGTPQTIWRYEVEYKRKVAAAHCSALSSLDDCRAEVASTVHRWFASRGVQPTWSAGDIRLSNGAALSEPDRDTLAWFRSSLSKTIAKEIRRHGIEAVLDALGLSSVVQPKRRR